MDNRERLFNSVMENFKQENGLDDFLLFEIFAISQILKDKNIDSEDIKDSIVDGGNDGGIDSIILLINDIPLSTIEELMEMSSSGEICRKTSLELFIIQTKNSDSFKEKPIDTLHTTITDIFNYDIGESELKKLYNLKLINRMLLLRNSIDTILAKSNKVKINFIYASKGNTKDISINVRHKADHLRNHIISKSNISDVTMNFYGAEELREIFTEPDDIDLIIKYKEHLSSTYTTEKEVGYIIIADVKEYYSFITDEDKNIRENIFESNVRHFQGNVEVNSGIMETLERERNIEFWWLNNGITIIASEIIPMPDNKLRLQNIQIVNGLQTTFCIYNHFKSDIIDGEKRSILIKIIKTQDIRTMDRIISTTNSQTEIRAADLRATDNFQRDLEQFFLSKGYYYDRRKKYYKNLHKDRNRIFTIAKSAQYIETLLYKKPHIARRNPTSLIKNDDNYRRIFNCIDNIDIYLKVCLIYKKVDEFIKEVVKNTDPIHEKYGASIQNLILQIMLIITILYFNNSDYTKDDLSNMNIDDINLEMFNKSIEMLIKILENIEEDGEMDNIINMAKSSKFTERILKYLSDNI